MTRRADSGFTLIEVLVAFAILAVTLTSVSGALSSGMMQERAADRATARVLEARSILDRIGTDLSLREPLWTGMLATGEPWSATVRPLSETGDTPFAAYDVVLTVAGGNGPALTLRTLKLGGWHGR